MKTEDFRAIDWAARGREACDEGFDHQDPDAAYSGCESQSPWSDAPPREVGDLRDEYDDGDRAVEEAIDEAREAYDSAYIEREEELAGQASEAREEQLRELGEAGWRICVFGLPGSSAHRFELAAPGQADEVSDRLYCPGPFGPYESAILTPLDADACTYQDGSRVYGAVIDELLARDPKGA